MDNVLAVILAGGKGERLSVLSRERAKPAIPFASKYRIIDFALSNAVNSGIHKVFILTQYEPLSLAEHIGIGMPWGLVFPDRSVRLIQAHLAAEGSRDWYRGTADAVYQNLEHIVEVPGIDYILILSGDHVYKMDYSAMLEFHKGREADATLAVTPIPDEELRRFGTVVTDERGQVIRFQEKVSQPQSNLASMGVYLFKKDILRMWLEVSPKPDFARDIFPKMVGRGKIFAYTFEGYWRDIGTVESYWQTNMDLLEASRSLITDPRWPIRTREVSGPPTMILGKARVVNCLVSGGCTIDGTVEHSVLSPGVTVAEGAVVRDSVIMNNTVIGKGSVIDRSILDEEVVVGGGSQIGSGDDLQPNRAMPKILSMGLNVIGRRAQIPPGTKINRNCIIHSNVFGSDFPDTEVPSGETIRPKRSRIVSSAESNQSG